MPLTPDDDRFLARLFNNLNPDEPLLPGDARYEPVYERPGCVDPMAELSRKIRRSETESTILLSACQGAGKTTELNRLRKDLDSSGYFVLYADAIQYINPALPITISDFLIALAGAFSDALAEKAIDIAGESYWTRLCNWLTKTNLELQEIATKLDADPVKAGILLKLELKSSPSFRQRLVDALSDRIGGMRDDVALFFEDGYKAIQRQRPDTQVVFIFDSLEKIQGSRFHWNPAIRSVQRLFTNHRAMLSIPYLHMVYTVPPWLKFLPNGLDMEVIPAVRTCHHDEARTRCEEGIAALASLVHKRLGEGGALRLFGPNHTAAVDQLILVSGGHFRDLLRLFPEIVLMIDELPATQKTFDRAIAEVRSSFLPIAVDDAVWLDRITRERASPLPTGTDQDISRLTRFLDSRIILYLRNGEDWHDIHPMVRDEVSRIAAAYPADTQP